MRILTGMQASGAPHIGNYFGMIKQSVELQNDSDNDCLYFIADLHAFTSHPDPKIFRKNQERAVIDWLALGIDPEKSLFYRQSDIRAHTELTWYLLTQTPMGMLERAHSYKDKKAQGMETNAGLFTYPVLMASDILLYDTDIVPVGKDQKQHVEMARDIAQKFNRAYGETFVVPEPQIIESVQTIPGLDGRKMSKSYNNTIEIFEDEKTLKKKIMSIPTKSIDMGHSMDPESCQVMAFHTLFQNPNVSRLKEQYLSGSIGFGESKKQLFEHIWDYFSVARTKREKLLSNPSYIQKILQKGAQKANERANKKLDIVRKNMGLSSS